MFTGLILFSVVVVVDICSSQRYVGFATTTPWTTANARCSNECEGGQLATWSNQEQFDQMVVAAQMGQPPTWGVMVGIRKGGDGKYSFIDGGDNCGDCLGEWPNSNAEDCGFVFPYDPSPYVAWHSCPHPSPYVCECPPPAPPVAPVAPVAPVTPVYVGVQHLASWAQASDACSKVCEGGFLATWSTQAQYDQIVATAQDDIRDAGVWVGLSAIHLEVKWSFVSGDKCTGDCATLSQWQAGQPNDRGAGEDCAAILEDAQRNVVLLDKQCDSQRHYICECPTEGNVRCPAATATATATDGAGGAAVNYHVRNVHVAPGPAADSLGLNNYYAVLGLLVVVAFVFTTTNVYICVHNNKLGKNYQQVKAYTSE